MFQGVSPLPQFKAYARRSGCAIGGCRIRARAKSSDRLLPTANSGYRIAKCSTERCYASAFAIRYPCSRSTSIRPLLLSLALKSKIQYAKRIMRSRKERDWVQAEAAAGGEIQGTANLK